MPGIADGTVGPGLTQGQQHVAATRKQRRISLTQQCHLLAGTDGLLQLLRRRSPGGAPRFGGFHHREQQGQTLMVAADPGRGDFGGHAVGPRSSDRVGHHLRLADGFNGGQGEQGRIAGADPHQCETPSRGGIDDGQQSMRPGSRR
jgi:hypothetical protein